MLSQNSLINDFLSNLILVVIDILKKKTNQLFFGHRPSRYNNFWLITIFSNASDSFLVSDFPLLAIIKLS